MKRTLEMLFSVLVVVAMVIPALPVNAQGDDDCAPESIVAGFSAAVAAGAVDDWAAGVAGGDCSDAIKQGAAGLAESYAAMMVAPEPEVAEPESAEPEGEELGEPAAEVPEIAYGGENPVVEYANVLGLTATVEVIRYSYYDPQRCISLGAAVEIAPRIFITSDLENIRQIRQEEDHYVVVYADGKEIPGKPMFYITEKDGPRHDLDGITEFRVVSVPEPEEDSSSDDEVPQVWALDIPELELSYTGTSPYWRYREVSCNTTVIGGSPYGGTTSVTIRVNDQDITVPLSDLTAVTLGEGDVTVTVPSGQQTTGKFVSEGGSRWFFRLQIDDLRQVWVDSSVTFSLTKVE